MFVVVDVGRVHISHSCCVERGEQRVRLEVRQYLERFHLLANAYEVDFALSQVELEDDHRVGVLVAARFNHFQQRRRI